MKANIFAVSIAFLAAASALAQEAPPQLLDSQRAFARGDLSAKLEAVESASRSGGSAMGPLYSQAIDFSLANAELLKDDPVFYRLVAAAVREVGSSENVQSASALWRIFTAFRDTGIRVAALKSLSALGKGDGQTVDNLNQFLANQNKLQRSGVEVDLDTVYACVEALGVLADGSSYGPLFTAMTSSYPDRVSLRAAESLHLLKGDYKRFLVDAIRRNPPQEKLVAYRAGMANDAFSVAERGELSETALGVALSLLNAGSADASVLAELRYAAVLELTELRWVRSAADAVKHFYIVQTDYGNGSATKERFIESIVLLGSVSSSESAQALSLQLGLINADMERSSAFDREILLAVIDALGSLGDKVAFDYLLYIGYLDYPEDIKAAAREALNRLTW